MAPKGWKHPFDDPIPLPRGRELVTLEDAASYSNAAANRSKLTHVPITGAFQTRETTMKNLVVAAAFAAKAFLDMLGVFAEFETNLRRERHKASPKRKPLASTRADRHRSILPWWRSYALRAWAPQPSRSASGSAGPASIAPCSARAPTLRWTGAFFCPDALADEILFH
jgi:hypothetical protein